MTKTNELAELLEKRSKRAWDVGTLIGNVSTIANDIENYIIPKVENRTDTFYDRKDISDDLSFILLKLKDIKVNLVKIEL